MRGSALWLTESVVASVFSVASEEPAVDCFFPIVVAEEEAPWLVEVVGDGGRVHPPLPSPPWPPPPPAPSPAGPWVATGGGDLAGADDATESATSLQSFVLQHFQLVMVPFFSAS